MGFRILWSQIRKLAPIGKKKKIELRPKFSLLHKQLLASQEMLCSKQFYESKRQLTENSNIYPVGVFKMRIQREL